MGHAQRHAWDVTPAEAVAIQKQLAAEVVAEDRLGPVYSVAGVDVGFEDEGRITRAAVAVLTYPDLTLQASVVARRATSFPYIPGLLSFRETPAVLEALEQLPELPDILLCDGHGYAHPRRFGIACHVGVLVDAPSIGVAKSPLVGTHAPVPAERGAWEPVLAGGEVVGAALCTRPGTKPIYVSVGHRISLPTAIAYVLGCTTRYRLPETTRWAHHLASQTPTAP